jgi:hypothetical protein
MVVYVTLRLYALASSCFPYSYTVTDAHDHVYPLAVVQGQKEGSPNPELDCVIVLSI